jgi:hypothetical protein
MIIAMLVKLSPMALSRGNLDVGPPSPYQRTVMIVAVTFTVLAATIYVVVLLLGGATASEVGRVFLPVAIAATGIALVASIAAIVDERSRTVGITTAIVLVPCAFLAALSLVALFS